MRNRRSRSFFQSIEVLVGSQEQRPAGNGNGGEGPAVEPVAGQLLKLLARRDHCRLPVFIQKVDPAIGVDRRGREIPPRRSRQWVSPVRASRHVPIPLSLTT